MQIQIELTAESRATIASLGVMGKAVLEAVSSGLFKGCQIAAGNIIRNYISGQQLKIRTGNLAKAVTGWLNKPLEGAVGINSQDMGRVSKYAWLLTDEQKTIVPIKGKFLAIPIGEGLTAGGAARYSSPREVPDGFFLRSKSGGLLFGIKRGKKGKFRPLFALVKSVFVQGSGALYDGVLDSVPQMTKTMETEIDKATF